MDKNDIYGVTCMLYVSHQKQVNQLMAYYTLWLKIISTNNVRPTGFCINIKKQIYLKTKSEKPLKNPPQPAGAFILASVLMAWPRKAQTVSWESPFNEIRYVLRYILFEGTHIAKLEYVLHVAVTYLYQSGLYVI